MIKIKKLYLKTPAAARRLKKGMGYNHLEQKAAYFSSHVKARARKRWYFRNYKGYRFRLRLRRLIRFLRSVRIPFKLPDFLRWIMIDFLRGKGERHWGIYCYVANPGGRKNPFHGRAYGAGHS